MPIRVGLTFPISNLNDSGVALPLKMLSPHFSMNPSQTVPFPLPEDLESEPEAQDSPSRTVTMSDLMKDVGNSALAKLDALHSLVQQEGKVDGRGSTSPHTSEAAEEQLDDYMKRFMERMTGRKEEEPFAPVQPAQPAPEAAPPPVARQPTRAPESSESLHQMRDLANENSRSALISHQRRLLNSNILVSFVPAAAASLASSGVAVLVLATGLRWQLGSAALLAVAFVLGFKFWSVSRRLIRNAQ